MNSHLNTYRAAISLTGLLIGLNCFGQKEQFTQEVKSQIPTGWIVRDSATGDINKDGLTDLILVAQSDNKDDYKTQNDSFGYDSINSNKRILFIFLKDMNGFTLFDKIDGIIPEHVSPTMDDPYSGISIKKGILQVGYYFWANMGSWSMFSTEYKFRYQDEDFYLIGIEHDNTNRGSGEREKVSINFLIRKMNIQKFPSNSDEMDNQSTSSEWKSFTLETLLKISEVVPTNVKVLDKYL